MSVFAHLIILKTAVAYMCILSLCRWSLEMQKSKAVYEDELVSGDFFRAFSDRIVPLYSQHSKHHSIMSSYRTFQSTVTILICWKQRETMNSIRWGQISFLHHPVKDKQAVKVFCLFSPLRHLKTLKMNGPRFRWRLWRMNQFKELRRCLLSKRELL